jgi:hypothetical protein
MSRLSVDVISSTAGLWVSFALLGALGLVTIGCVCVGLLILVVREGFQLRGWRHCARVFLAHFLAVHAHALLYSLASHSRLPVCLTVGVV